MLYRYALAAAACGIAFGAAAQDNEGDPFAAANGPIPGDLGAVADEWACTQARETPGYFKSLNGAEVSDSERSQFYPCASFLGSMTGPNDVYAW
jgi:hypothetical protein